MGRKYAQVVESVDTQDLKSCGFTAVRVQVPPWVQKNKKVKAKALTFFVLRRNRKPKFSDFGVKQKRGQKGSAFWTFLFPE